MCCFKQNNCLIRCLSRYLIKNIIWHKFNIMVTSISPLKCMKKGFKLIITNILHKNRNATEISYTHAGNRFLHFPSIQCLFKIFYEIQISATEKYCKRMLKTPLNFITRCLHECFISRLVTSEIFDIYRKS